MSMLTDPRPDSRAPIKVFAPKIDTKAMGYLVQKVKKKVQKRPGLRPFDFLAPLATACGERAKRRERRLVGLPRVGA